jgi:hypothetical protein
VTDSRRRGASRGSKVRPRFSARIDELELEFQGAGGRRETLEALLFELSHRSVPRAIALRQRVEEALGADPYGPQAGWVEGVPPPASFTSGKKQDGERSLPTSTLYGDGESVASLAEESSSDARDPATSSSPALKVDFGESSQHRPPRNEVDARLAAWLAHEVLTPQALPKDADLKAQGQQLFYLEEDPEPWSDPRHGRHGKERGVFWLLCLGEIPLEQASSELSRHFPGEISEEIALARGRTTIAILVLDGAGRPVEDRCFLSSFAWGIGRVVTGNLHALASFPAAERQLCAALPATLIRRDRTGEILPVRDSDVKRLTRQLTEALHLPAELIRSHGLAVRTPVRTKKVEPPDSDLLNSFFVEDLSRVREAVFAGDAGAGLRAYLAANASVPEVDVRKDPRAVEAAIAPAQLPLARWPIPGGHSLVLMQQAAVNHAVAELREPGLVAVNGPPGTGKTTLLRDVIAAVIAERAEALTDFADPEDAFTHLAPIRLGNGFMHLYSLDERLLGHEIVVASSNNKAVENVSREIPAGDAIASEAGEAASYFRSVAESVAVNGDDDRLGEVAAWGMVAAVLGNKSNRYLFTRAFWWHQERGMSAYLAAVAEGWNPELEEIVQALPEVVRLEKAPHSRSEALERWEHSRLRFRAARTRVQQMVDQLENGRSALLRRDKVLEELGRLATARRTTTGARDRATRALREADKSLASARTVEGDDESRRREHWMLRPGWIARCFRTRSYRVWLAAMRPIQQALAGSRAGRQKAEQEQEACFAVASRLSADLDRLASDERGLQVELDQCHQEIAAAAKIADHQIPDGALWERDRSAAQMQSPWLGRALQQARDEVFICSLLVHRAFIDAAAQKIRHNLASALAVMQGRSLAEKQEPARRSLWATLSLVVPVISTTFALMSRLFGPMGRESLGWLLIDEAGQALPQAAVGAIWRARRSLVIGDPLQIPPVVTTPVALVEQLYRQFGVEADRWAAPQISAQTLADQASWFGTAIRRPDGDLWVGCPLRVHRRCEEPMFSIANQVAYGGLMVQATPAGKGRIGDILGASAWFDVEGEAEGKWSPAEGRTTVALLRALFDDLSDPDVFFITPFRVVAQRLREALRTDAETRERFPDLPWRWVRDRVGTIHTFQGKEAESVVLVLGAPSESSEGARRWAGSAPNLLNVAVSRAKERLYVVGNRQRWQSQGHFRTLARWLPVKTHIDSGQTQFGAGHPADRA